MREILDERGARWRVIAEPTVVAHARRGAVLAFVPADTPDAPAALWTPISFNSMEAAEAAITTMSETELNRRLAMARQTAPR